ncbi:hypothetical protein, partial [Sorangium cellulosum]|uniref:hypothetical protein n=1 Tax=Sorangium cellulosum TaxID=56 RepID=UPI001F372C5C
GRPSTISMERGSQRYAGGCQPTSAQRRRAATIVARFIRSAMTVALPDGVTPSTLIASTLHVK